MLGTPPVTTAGGYQRHGPFLADHSIEEWPLRFYDAAHRAPRIANASPLPKCLSNFPLFIALLE